MQRFLETVRIAVIGEIRIARVRANKAPSVLDRAPILFGATGNFTDIGDEPIAIRIISAIELFENVQVGEMMTVEDQEVAASSTKGMIKA